MPGRNPETRRRIFDTHTDIPTRIGPGRIANPFADFPRRNSDLSRLIHDRFVKRMMRVVDEQPSNPRQRVLALLRGGLWRAPR